MTASLVAESPAIGVVNTAVRNVGLIPGAPGQGEEDCVAATPDYSDWQITVRLLLELFCIKGRRWACTGRCGAGRLECQHYHRRHPQAYYHPRNPLL